MKKPLAEKVAELIPPEETLKIELEFEQAKNQRMMENIEKALARMNKGGAGTRTVVKSYLKEAMEYGRANL